MLTSEPPPSPTASQEWLTHWPMVAAAMLGVSLGTVPAATLGLFMDPLNREFGWSRTEISAGLTIFALVSLPLTPLAGVLIDKFGPRRVAIPGLTLSCVMFAAFGLLTGSLFQWMGLWVLYTLASLLIRTVVWNTAVSGAFTIGRGFAIAVLLCGTGFAQALSPIVARWLIDTVGWRGAYVGLGIGWGGLALVACFLFFHVRRRADSSSSPGVRAIADRPVGGLSVKEALRSSTMYRIAVAIFLQVTMGVAMMVHMVPILIGSGISRSEAAGVVALLGIGSVAGKLLTGWLMDRVEGSLLPSATFACPLVAYAIFLQESQSPLLLAAAVVLLGYAAGATLQLATYLTSRYAGLHSFGTIFGFVSSIMALAAGTGPVLAGAIFDYTGSYTALFIAAMPTTVIAAIAVFKLGPYPVFAAAPPEIADNVPPQPA